MGKLWQRYNVGGSKLHAIDFISLAVSPLQNSKNYRPKLNVIEKYFS